MLKELILIKFGVEWEKIVIVKLSTSFYKENNNRAEYSYDLNFKVLKFLLLYKCN